MLRAEDKGLRSWAGHSIAHRLTVQVILFSTLVACLATALQLYLDYRRDVHEIYAFFADIEQSSLRPLEESVWILDDLQIHLQLEGLITRENIVHAAVEMDGQIAWTRGTPRPSDGISHSFPLRHLIRGRPEEIGRLHVTATLDGIHQRLRQRIIVLLASNAIKTFLVAGFILLLFQKSLTRHLIRLASFAEHIDLKQGQPEPLQLDRPAFRRPDELDQVTTALNGLCASGHQALRELEIQQERVRLLLDATEEGVLGVDAAGRCTFINRVGRSHFSPGVPPGSLIGRNILELPGFGDREGGQNNGFSTQIRTTIREGATLLTDEMEVHLADGRSLLIALRSYPVLEDGHCTGAIVFYADISRQHQLEQEKLLFTKVIRQAPALILITDSEGIVEYVNTSFEQIMGCEGGELKGRRALDCLPGLNPGEQIEPIRARIGQGEAWSGTLTHTTCHRRSITLDATIFPILNRQGRRTHVVAMGRDSTREQLLASQLLHAQKMEAVGKLAASIAHEFGNPLLGVRFALRDVQQQPELGTRDRHLLHLAESECDRMRKLIRDLQQFSRPSRDSATVFDLHRILDEILALNDTFLARRRVVPIRAYDRRALLVAAVEDQLRQVFLNLIINAVDAMADQGGTLILRTLWGEDERVVEVEDNGPGIAPHHLDRIFEPFFTTKAAVEGTGLGLPVSYGIVRAHGGTISVQSEPGRTVFRVVLPAAAATESGEEQHTG